MIRVINVRKIVNNVIVKILVLFAQNLIYPSKITVNYVIFIMACLFKAMNVRIVLLIVCIVRIKTIVHIAYQVNR